VPCGACWATPAPGGGSGSEPVGSGSIFNEFKPASHRLQADGLLRTYSAKLSGPELLLTSWGLACARESAAAGALRDNLWLVGSPNQRPRSQRSEGACDLRGHHRPYRRRPRPYGLDVGAFGHSGDGENGDGLERVAVTRSGRCATVWRGLGFFYAARLGFLMPLRQRAFPGVGKPACLWPDSNQVMSASVLLTIRLALLRLRSAHQNLCIRDGTWQFRQSRTTPLLQTAGHGT